MAYDANRSQYNSYWWKSSSAQIASDIFGYVDYIREDQSYRPSDNLRFMRMYGNYYALGLDSYSYSRVETSGSNNHRVTLNIVQSMIDTATSKITKNRPLPTFLTDGGDWKLQQKAKKLNKFVEGMFYSSDFYKEASMAFLESCIFGTGAIKFYIEDNCVKAERVFIDELVVDDIEGFYGKPRQMHQVKYMHKEVLKAQFPDKIIQIDAASEGADAYYSASAGSKTAKEMIRVIESWHLPSSNEKDDGKRVISIRDCLLFEEEYTKDYFPFVFTRWTERPIGFYGQGLAEQLSGLQLEINKILRTIQISMHLVSVPKLLVEAGSKVVTSHLNNKIGGIIKYAGTAPQYQSLGGIPRELFSHLDYLYQRAYEITGISQLSATSSKPSGLDSGKALREYSDIESERFMFTAKRYEQLFMDAAKMFVNMARDIYEETGDMKVKVPGKKFIETIDWKDIDLKDDQYMMKVFPTSSLSKSPSGRLQDVQELLQAGFISKEDGMKLLDFPDLEQATNLYNAAVEDIDNLIFKIIDKNEYQAPEPYQNLPYGIQKCQQAYLYYRSQGAPEETLELFRRWIEEADGLMQRAQQQQENLAPEVAGLAPQQAQPLATPEASPTSELLPNTPGSQG